MSARRTPSTYASWATGLLCGVAAMAAVAAASAVVGLDDPASPAGTAQPGILLAQASDRRPSDTATDWVTYADYVVVATAVTDREIAPDVSEVRLGEGLVSREVQMRVDRVIWSSDSAPVAAPTSWSRTSMGWAFSDGLSNRREMGIADSPRVEVGHTYVVALEWVEDPCAAGEGQWLGLGEGATVPFDTGAVGVGEYEGDSQTLGEATAAKEAHGPDFGLEERLAGKGGAAIGAALAAARPAPAAERVADAPSTCDDGVGG